MVANLGCRKDILLGGEIGAGHSEDFWGYPDGDVKRIYERPCANEHIIDPFLVFSSLEMSELWAVGKSAGRVLPRGSDQEAYAGWWGR